MYHMHMDQTHFHFSAEVGLCSAKVPNLTCTLVVAVWASVFWQPRTQNPQTPPTSPIVGGAYVLLLLEVHGMRKVRCSASSVLQQTIVPSAAKVRDGKSGSGSPVAKLGDR